MEPPASPKQQSARSKDGATPAAFPRRFRRSARASQFCTLRFQFSSSPHALRCSPSSARYLCPNAFECAWSHLRSNCTRENNCPTSCPTCARASESESSSRVRVVPFRLWRERKEREERAASELSLLPASCILSVIGSPVNRRTVSGRSRLRQPKPCAEPTSAFAIAAFVLTRAAVPMPPASAIAGGFDEQTQRSSQRMSRPWKCINGLAAAA